MKSHRFTHRQAQLGTLLFAVGLSVFALAAWDNSSGLPFAMPAFWHNQRMLCLLVALVLAAFGWYSGRRCWLMVDVLLDRLFIKARAGLN